VAAAVGLRERLTVALDLAIGLAEDPSIQDDQQRRGGPVMFGRGRRDQPSERARRSPVPHQSPDFKPLFKATSGQIDADA
jgi:hypothetical protein